MVTAEKSVGAPHQLLERLSNARSRSDALFNLVRADARYERPIPERHRIVFYIGHLEAFDWNLLNGSSFGVKSVHPEFDRLFAFGIDPVGGGLPTDVPADWPSLDAVYDYVNLVRNALDQQLVTAISEEQARNGFPLHTLLNVAVEHRLMHVETLAYMLHQLPINMKSRTQANQEMLLHLAGVPLEHHMLVVPTGAVTLGIPRGAENFAWDNEYESHLVDVPGFEIDRYKVTNRQYLEFMAAGGYETPSFWNDEDWNWKSVHEISHPLFWKNENGRWLYRGMFDEISFDDLPSVLDWPVYVSQAEATAYAGWAGRSLPTEAEWQRAACATPDGDTRAYPWGNEPPNPRRGNFDFARWDPTPVNAFPESESAFGARDMLGNGWEWTSSIFAPFPGFRPFPFYRGYSADFFDGKHFVMKGGSARTAACMLRSTFRNWFQAHYQYVYAGFRCVKRGL
jgi:gamma-glutamyl hercynylcysteine S-oxide synthase